MEQKLTDNDVGYNTYSWNESRDLIVSGNCELRYIIDDLSASMKYPLIHMSYPYGAQIYKDGLFYVPTKSGGVVPLRDVVDTPLKNFFQSLHLPLGYCINNSFEVFTEQNGIVSPLAFRRCGLELGIWEMFAPPAVYNVVAGSRTFVMLPKAADFNSHKNLAEFGVKGGMPISPFDFWYILKDISDAKPIDKRWSCDIIFFTREWVERIRREPKWVKLNHYVLTKAWRHTELTRYSISYDTAWHNFSEILTNKRIKLNTYLNDTIKKLIYIAAGLVPAFVPVTDTEYAAPFHALIEAYLEGYKMKNYFPSLLYTDYFNCVEGEPVYYSLQAPTQLNSSTKSKASLSARKDLISLIEMLDLLRESVSSGQLGASGEILRDLFSRVDFEFFHTEADVNKGVYSSLDLYKEDERFSHFSGLGLSEKRFCERSFFMRGCIKIMKK